MVNVDYSDLAKQIVRCSLKIQPGEKVFIDVGGVASGLVEQLIETIYEAGAIPFVQVILAEHHKRLLKSMTRGQALLLTKQMMYRLRSMDAYINIIADENSFEEADVPSEQYDLYTQHYSQPLQQAMIGIKKWLLIKHPTYGQAQWAKMSLDSFTNLHRLSCTIDYNKLVRLAEPLVEYLERTNEVNIVSPGTSLKFSVQGSPRICNGVHNLPGGEVYTAPILDSVEGYITFNVPTSYMGTVFDKVYLRFHKGKVVEVDSSNSRIKDILETDEGASRIGEFGIGLNPCIRRPTQITAYDEKMMGSLHIALGQAYEDADNGNRSKIHWDLVLCQFESFGGGQLYFDNKLVREDGFFVPPILRSLDHWEGV